MTWLRSVASVLLHLAAGAAAVIVVWADRLTQRSARRKAEEELAQEQARRQESERLAAKFKAKVEAARAEIEERRGAALEMERRRLECERDRQLEKDPVQLANELIEEAQRARR